MGWGQSRVKAVAIAVLLIASATSSPVALAAPSYEFAVNSTADTPDASSGDGVCADMDGSCSLRAATQEANALPAGSQITISVPAGTYSLSAGSLLLSATSVTLSGADASSVTIAGNGTFTVLQVGGTTQATVSGVTISGGSAGSNGQAGGILNQGVLTLSACVLSGNSATSGGGILNDNALSMSGCTVSGNSASYGGSGLANAGTATISDSTFVGNHGGARSFGGGISSSGPLIVSNSTLSGNSAAVGSAIAILSGSAGLNVTASTISGNLASVAGAVAIAQSAASFQNSTIASNLAQRGPGGVVTGVFVRSGVASFPLDAEIAAILPQSDATSATTNQVVMEYSTVSRNSLNNVYGAKGHSQVTLLGSILSGGLPNCSGTAVTDLGYNLTSDASCGLTQATSLTNTNPMLNLLANNGGPTQTMALLPTSPAINAGGSGTNGCPTTDQRGVARPQGLACDIGAYEAPAAPATVHSPAVQRHTTTPVPPRPRHRAGPLAG